MLPPRIVAPMTQSSGQAASGELPFDPEHDPQGSYVFEPDYIKALTDRIVSSTGESVRSYAPATGQPLAVIPQSSEQDVGEAVARARKAQQAWAQTRSTTARRCCCVCTTWCSTARTRSST